MAPFRIFVAGPNEMTRCVVTEILTTHRGWEVCGEIADGQMPVEATARLQPDIVLLDVRGVGADRWASTRQIVRNNPDQKLIALGDPDSEKLVHEAFHAGAFGFVPIPRVRENLVSAIEALQGGRSFFTPRLADLILQDLLKGDGKTGDPGSLTQREREAVHLLSKEVSHGPLLRPAKRNASNRLLKYFLITVILTGTVYLLWDRYSSTIEEVPVINTWLVRLGLKAPAASVESPWNPDTQVWINVHTALYYCPGTPSYGKTPGGKFAAQREARADSFQPANRKGCN
jgi:DNA-binding NarL/FixJ family response regulator